MRVLLLVLVAFLASASSFVVHVFSVEWLPHWIDAQMQEAVMESSWNVRYIAMFTSVEYGIAAVLLYFLSRDKLAKFGRFGACIIFAILLAAIHGAFIRQPFMDLVIGNPIQVVIVQDGLTWLIWLLMSTIVVNGVESIIRTKKNSMPT
jgi:hypothetical protein